MHPPTPALTVIDLQGPIVCDCGMCNQPTTSQTLVPWYEGPIKDSQPGERGYRIVCEACYALWEQWDAGKINELPRG